MVGFVSFWLLFALIPIVDGVFQLPVAFWLTFLVIWMVAYLGLEALSLWHKIPLPNTLAHLRYAPLAITLFSLSLITIYDLALVEYSRHQIRAYVYGNTPPNQDVRLALHNTDRGFCGNGRMATLHWLYADTAAEGLSSSDAAVRARALRVSLQVFYGSLDDRLYGLTKGAEHDEDPLVREMATAFFENKAANQSTLVGTAHSGPDRPKRMRRRWNQVNSHYDFTAAASERHD
jgi:hypothetical protein